MVPKSSTDLLLSRTITSSETRRKYSDIPVSCPWIVEMVVVYDKGFSAVSLPQTWYLLSAKMHSKGPRAALRR